MKAWLSRILTTTFITGYRKRQRELRLAAIGEIPDRQLARVASQPSSGLRSAEGGVLDRQPNPRLTRALQALSDDFRTVVYLAMSRATPSGRSAPSWEPRPGPWPRGCSVRAANSATTPPPLIPKGPCTMANLLARRTRGAALDGLRAEGLTILVTGATDGLGRAVSSELARRGAAVLLHRHSDARLADNARQIADAAGSRRPRTYRADLSSVADVRLLAEHVLEEEAQLDGIHRPSAYASARSAQR